MYNPNVPEFLEDIRNDIEHELTVLEFSYPTDNVPIDRINIMKGKVELLKEMIQKHNKSCKDC